MDWLLEGFPGQTVTHLYYSTLGNCICDYYRAAGWTGCPYGTRGSQSSGALYLHLSIFSFLRLLHVTKLDGSDGSHGKCFRSFMCLMKFMIANQLNQWWISWLLSKKTSGLPLYFLAWWLYACCVVVCPEHRDNFCPWAFCKGKKWSDIEEEPFVHPWHVR